MEGVCKQEDRRSLGLENGNTEGTRTRSSQTSSSITFEYIDATINQCSRTSPPLFILRTLAILLTSSLIPTATANPLQPTTPSSTSIPKTTTTSTPSNPTSLASNSNSTSNTSQPRTNNTTTYILVAIIIFLILIIVLILLLNYLQRIKTRRADLESKTFKLDPAPAKTKIVREKKRGGVAAFDVEDEMAFKEGGGVSRVRGRGSVYGGSALGSNPFTQGKREGSVGEDANGGADGQGELEPPPRIATLTAMGPAITIMPSTPPTTSPVGTLRASPLGKGGRPRPSPIYPNTPPPRIDLANAELLALPSAGAKERKKARESVDTIATDILEPDTKDESRRASSGVLPIDGGGDGEKAEESESVYSFVSVAEGGISVAGRLKAEKVEERESVYSFVSVAEGGSSVAGRLKAEKEEEAGIGIAKGE